MSELVYKFTDKDKERIKEIFNYKKKNINKSKIKMMLNSCRTLSKKEKRELVEKILEL